MFLHSQLVLEGKMEIIIVQMKMSYENDAIRTDVDHRMNQNASPIPKAEKTCNLCKVKFSTNCEYESHMINQHSAEKPNTCKVCGKSFHLKWRLEKHVKIHDKDEP